MVLIFELLKSTKEIFDIYISRKNEGAADDLMSTTAYVRIPCFHYKYAHDMVNLINMTKSKTWTFTAQFEGKSIRHNLEKRKTNAVTAWAWCFQGEAPPDAPTKMITDPTVLTQALEKKSFKDRLNAIDKAAHFSITDVTMQKDTGLWQAELDVLAGLETYKLGKLIMSASSVHAVLHEVATRVMQNYETLRCFTGVLEMHGNHDIMEVAKHDLFLTLDDDFPLNMGNIEHEGKIMKEFYHKKDQGDDKHEQGGIMAIKYMVCQGGNDVLFINCGVILKGCVSTIVGVTQKRVITSLLRRHISTESFNSFLGPTAGVYSSSASSSGARVEIIED